MIWSLNLYSNCTDDLATKLAATIVMLRLKQVCKTNIEYDSQLSFGRNRSTTFAIICLRLSSTNTMIRRLVYWFTIFVTTSACEIDKQFSDDWGIEFAFKIGQTFHFDMFFHLLLTKFSRELFLCSQRIENVVNYSKRPIDLAKQ